MTLNVTLLERSAWRLERYLVGAVSEEIKSWKTTTHHWPAVNPPGNHDNHHHECVCKESWATTWLASHSWLHSLSTNLYVHQTFDAITIITREDNSCARQVGRSRVCWKFHRSSLGCRTDACSPRRKICLYQKPTCVTALLFIMRCHEQYERAGLVMRHSYITVVPLVLALE